MFNYAYKKCEHQNLVHAYFSCVLFYCCCCYLKNCQNVKENTTLIELEELAYGLRSFILLVQQLNTYQHQQLNKFYTYINSSMMRIFISLFLFFLFLYIKLDFMCVNYALDCYFVLFGFYLMLLSSNEYKYYNWPKH